MVMALTRLLIFKVLNFTCTLVKETEKNKTVDKLSFTLIEVTFI